jgi:hypothetical protein
VGVYVGDEVIVGVLVGVDVGVGVIVGALVGVDVGVAVGGTGVGVLVGVGVFVGTLVGVGVGVGVGVFVGVLVGGMLPRPTVTEAPEPLTEFTVIVTPESGSVKLCPTTRAGSVQEPVPGVMSSSSLLLGSEGEAQ